MITLLHLFTAAALSARAAAPLCTDSLADRLKTKLTPVLAQRATEGTFAGVVLVACEGKPIYSVAYGLSNRATNTKNALDTRFNLGSMNKMWTAIAIAQLVELGKIDVNAPVGKYLPDLPNRAVREKVLVRHLLTHTSGLGTYFKRGYLRDRVPLTKAADLLRFFIEDSLDFEPGARFQYSNAGFAMLGVIVERVSGMNFFEYMRKNILERAGMSTGAFITSPVADNSVALGYAVPMGGTEPQENTDLIERTSGPAGGAFATAGDIVAFSRALWGGKLVGLPLVNEFTRGKVDMAGLKYAYGFGDGLANGARTVGHNGGGPGISTDFLSFPDQGVDVVVLTNIDDPAAGQVMGIAVSLVAGGPVRQLIGRGGGSGRSGGPGGPADQMPDAPIGRRTAAFLAAFNAGAASMTTFIAEQMTPSDTPAAERAKSALAMHDRIGNVTFKRVLSMTPTRLVVIVDSEKGAQLKITTEVEGAAPFRMLPRPDFNPFP